MLAVGGTEDHAHLLVRLPPAAALSNAIRAAKGSASAVVNRSSDPGLSSAWQARTGALPVCEHMVPRMIDDIRTQTRHHHGFLHVEEYDQLLEQNGIEPKQPVLPD